MMSSSLRLGRLCAPGLVVLVCSCLAPVALAQEAEPTLSAGDTAWMLTSSALVLMMTLPGLALFYGGLVRGRNILSVLMQNVEPHVDDGYEPTLVCELSQHPGEDGMPFRVHRRTTPPAVSRDAVGSAVSPAKPAGI